MNFDRQISISAGTNRKDTHWKRLTMTVSELYDKLRLPSRGAETLAAYVKMKKSQQDNLKDVGGYMAGTLSGGRRKASAVTGRDVITLDFDNIPAWGTDDVIAKLDELGCSYCVYSTRKHAPNAPRLRILIPTDRTMTPDEYEPCARRVAAHVGISKADPTTFEVGRLMYWPSCCADSEYVYKTADAPLMAADFLLGTYVNWKDVESWPQVPGVFSYTKLAVKQGDPESKPGVVGAFCRTYDVFRAMDELLPGIYEATDDGKDRFTYTGGTTTGGAIVYDSGKFLFSHHATDPCSGRLVNAFDLVRLHKYGDMDDENDPNAPVNKLPSYKQMCQYAVSLDEVALVIMKEQHDKAIEDFTGVTAASDPAPTTPPTPSDDFNPGELAPDENDDDQSKWMLKLQREVQSGKIKGTIDNMMIILENDPLLKGRFALNRFANRGEVLAQLPWEHDYKHRRMWSDTDTNGLYWYVEKFYGITSRGNIDAALDVHAATHAFNDVQDYIEGLAWDGTPRLDTLFIDYLGATDDEYNRTVCRKAFVAAIARAMMPGCKFDCMLILCGPQGVGKSTILDKMSRGFFNDSIRTFEGKDASELLQGVWLIEVAELDAFRRTDVACIKQFLSLRADRYRAAYGRNVKELPRCCVFFGTCNQMDFLQDTTGNRRFWPVDVSMIPPAKSVFRDLDAEIDQIWAEAKARWQAGEELYLSGAVEEEARKRQEEHREALVQEGPIAEFTARQVPNDWAKWPIDRRRDYWANASHGDYTLVDRDRICAAEIWCELYGKNMSDMKKADAREINAALSRLNGWRRSEKVLYFGPYSTQRGCEKRF